MRACVLVSVCLCVGLKVEVTGMINAMPCLAIAMFFIHVCKRCTQKLNNHPLTPTKVGMRTKIYSAFYSSMHYGISVTETQAFSVKLEKTVQ